MADHVVVLTYHHAAPAALVRPPPPEKPRSKAAVSYPLVGCAADEVQANRSCETRGYGQKHAHANAPEYLQEEGALRL